MLVAHLPAAFVVTCVAPRLAGSRAFLVGALLPDADLLWWALVDAGRVHHHRYPTHLPLVWLCVLAGTFAAPLRARRAMRVTRAVALGALLHVVLDTVAGDIAWLWPLEDEFVSLVTVPPRGGFWLWSFVLHWTFAIELALCAAGLALWLRRARGALLDGRERRAAL